MKLQKLFFAAVIVLSANAAIAQDNNDTTTDNHTVTINIPTIALLDLEFETSDAIVLAGAILGGNEAGLPISFENAKNSNTWINYTSIVSGSATTTRDVTVSLTGTVPAGLKLTVAALAAAGGAGDLGFAVVTPTTITSVPKSIITGIGSAYTGDGASNGHNLTYQLGFDTNAATDYKDLDFDNSAALTITYTLSDI